ncbi:MAG: c-type cytochrome domain-containing protein [Chthoniobacter sp.]
MILPAPGAEKMDVSKLPPAATRPVDFMKDIQPIMESRCLKCHGPEKQKGGWRVDLKDAAMTGGDEHAPNIVPGKSAESPLIHFVAGLDPDMKMPAKGDPLTAGRLVCCERGSTRERSGPKA